MPVTGWDVRELFLHKPEGREGARTGPATATGLEKARAVLEHPRRPHCGRSNTCNPFKFSTQNPSTYDRQRVCFLCCLVSHPAHPPAPQGARHPKPSSPNPASFTSMTPWTHPSQVSGTAIACGRQVSCGFSLLHDVTRE